MVSENLLWIYQILNRNRLLGELHDWLILPSKLLRAIYFLAIVPGMNNALFFPLRRDHRSLMIGNVDIWMISRYAHRLIVSCMSSQAARASPYYNRVCFLYLSTLHLCGRSMPMINDMIRKRLIVSIEISWLMQAQVLLISRVVLVSLTLCLMIGDWFHIKACYSSVLRCKTQFFRMSNWWFSCAPIGKQAIRGKFNIIWSFSEAIIYRCILIKVNFGSPLLRFWWSLIQIYVWSGYRGKIENSLGLEVFRLFHLNLIVIRTRLCLLVLIFLTLLIRAKSMEYLSPKLPLLPI